jgi:hypothetical protein
MKCSDLTLALVIAWAVFAVEGRWLFCAGAAAQTSPTRTGSVPIQGPAMLGGGHLIATDAKDNIFVAAGAPMIAVRDRVS